jgi:hypothetical protein
MDGSLERRDPESYTWPLVAVGVVILPLLGIAARPGPVHRGARTVVLALAGALVVANAVAAARLVTLVLDDGDMDGVALSAGRLLVAATCSRSSRWRSSWWSSRA